MIFSKKEKEKIKKMYNDGKGLPTKVIADMYDVAEVEIVKIVHKYW